MTWNLDTITQLGLAYHRHGDTPFGLRLADRLQHIYLIGQTGTGKSTLLRRLAEQDAAGHIGLCLIDPHGDLASELHGRLTTPHRYWDVADPACPLGYNPLSRPPAQYRPLVASGLIDTLKKQWSDAWGVRMEHLLRYAILALLETPACDVRDILRLYTDKTFLYEVLGHVRDEQVRTFWLTEFPKLNYQTSLDGVAPIANKLGAWLAHPVVRKAICVPAEPLRFRRLMDDGGVLVVNLAKGRLGADTSNLVGGLLVSSVMNAAFTRYDLPPAERRPFFLYVDEFTSFTTATFATMLAEARKYGLGLILAQQHIVQAEHNVFESIMGNVGSLIVFRVGASDAPTIAKQLNAVPTVDLITLPNYRVMAQLMVRGSKTAPFSARTLQ